MQNFFDCVKSRKEPNAPVETGVAAARAGQIAKSCISTRRANLLAAEILSLNEERAPNLFFRGQMRRLWGVLASGFGELFEDRVEEPFPRNANVLGAPNFLFVPFADFRELSSRWSRELSSPWSNAERWPKLLAANLCVLCHFVSREAPEIESSYEPCSPLKQSRSWIAGWNRAARQCGVSGRLRTLLIFVRACLMFRGVAFQIAV